MEWPACPIGYKLPGLAAKPAATIGSWSQKSRTLTRLSFPRKRESRLQAVAREQLLAKLPRAIQYGQTILSAVDVLVAAFRSSEGASRQLLLAALDSRLTLLLTVPLVLEYEAVLTRPESLQALSRTSAKISSVLDALTACGHPVKLRFHWRPQLPDPDDEMVLEAAVNGGADLVVTFDLRHFESPAKNFGVQAVLPRDAFLILRGRGSYEKE
ncbi:MAG: PIN domain-containing protein [Acidobacteria bacterium]|nr:PIN domain-containing protein [Acidobacteriota bacterium]MCI0723357.1 PIN domain-containing protein [Acidobacteriota bacterium]